MTNPKPETWERFDLLLLALLLRVTSCSYSGSRVVFTLELPRRCNECFTEWSCFAISIGVFLSCLVICALSPSTIKSTCLSTSLEAGLKRRGCGRLRLDISARVESSLTVFLPKLLKLLSESRSRCFTVTPCWFMMIRRDPARLISRSAFTCSDFCSCDY